MAASETKAFRCKINDWYGLHNGFMLNLRPGFTAIVGPNGAGKTTLLSQIKEKARSKNYRTLSWSNLSDGGQDAMQRMLSTGDIKALALSASSSEGQNVTINFGNIVPKINESVQKTKNDGVPLFVFLDGIDSGLSIDRLQDIISLFQLIEKDAGVHPGGAEHPVYVLAAVNQYELARGYCIDARTGRPVSFADYTDYAKFITTYFDGKAHTGSKT